jgi:multiple sugar transport system ATP-binding protein
MAFGLMLRKMPREEISRRVGIAAKMLGLEDYLNRKPRQLSGGQRQRVALGRAIVREPKVFLFDEPLSNLDAKLRVSTRTEIKKLHQRLKTTTIYVTHDQEEAMTLGDRIVVMSAGRGYGCIEQVDTSLNVYKRPANRFVGSFLGRTPMNFLPCTVVDDQGLVAFAAPDIRLRIPERFAPGLRSFVGKPLTLGWRPSAMSEVPTGKFEGVGNTMTLKAILVEPLGRNIDVTCRTASGTEILARIDARDNFPVGSDITFHIDMEHVHLFDDGPFGANLLHPPDANTTPTPTPPPSPR